MPAPAPTCSCWPRFTNNGTLLANNGMLVVEGSGLKNVSGTTLSGGSYIVRGPTSGTFNQIEFGVNFTACRCREHHPGSARRRTSRSSAVARSSRSRHSYRPSPATGTLQLLSGRGYSTANTLTDDARLLVIAAAARYDTTRSEHRRHRCFSRASASSPVLSATRATSSPTAARSYVQDGTARLRCVDHHVRQFIDPGRRNADHSITNGRRFYNTGGLLDINGAVAVPARWWSQTSGTIDIGVATSQNVTFSGSNAEISLGTPQLLTAAYWRDLAKRHAGAERTDLQQRHGGERQYAGGEVKPARRSIRCRCQPTTLARPSARRRSAATLSSPTSPARRPATTCLSTYRSTTPPACWARRKPRSSAT